MSHAGSHPATGGRTVVAGGSVSLLRQRGPGGLQSRFAGHAGAWGKILTASCQLRGIFGVDGVLRDGAFLARGGEPALHGLGRSAGVCTTVEVFPSHGEESSRSLASPKEPDQQPIIAKAILFARHALTFPATGPWSDTLAHPPLIHRRPRSRTYPAPKLRSRRAGLF